MAECWRLAPPEALNKKTMMSASMRHPSFTPSSSSDNHNLNQPLIAFANHPYAFDTSSLQHPIEQPPIPRTTSYCMSAPSAFTTTAYDTTSRDFAFRPDTHLAAVTSAQDWQMYQTSMGVPVAAHPQGLKRVGSSQNIPTESQVQSTDQVSPFTHSAAFPQIANTEFAPTYHVDSKNLLPSTFHGQEYYPSQSAHTPLTHQPVRAYVVDYSTGDDIPPEFVPSARHSMSSYGNDSPATPQSVPAENVENSYNGNGEVKKTNGHIQLFRTESQAYQDELYNPPTTFSSTPAAAKPSSAYLSPHRNIISERLQTANMARSQSPTSAGTARERSPFRDHSPLAPTGDWRTPAAMSTAAGMRQQQKDQAAHAEYARTMPPLQREPTKTISPKDALLDYNDQEQSSLFQESIPQGYKQHNTGTGTEPWPTNGFVGQPGSSFGNLQASQPDTTFANPAAFNFEAMPATTGFESNVLSATSYPMATYNAAPKQNPYLAASDANPQFPATLTSMDSSISDNPPSSAEVADASIPRRPADTRANTGTYTCTYHGCTQRFETPGNLQKHKRDYHRAQTQQLHQQQREASASSPRHSGSSSPVRSTVSPAPSGSGMTSAALQARNSQAGPHKCTRTNPSTGKPCNTIFSRPYDLTRHEDTIHNGRKQKVRCPMCREEKTFSRNDALTRHMRVVHPEVENFGKRSRRD